MLMVLGLFVFERRTLPHQSMQYSKDYRWASNDRIGKPLLISISARGNLAHARACCTPKSPADACR